MPVSVLEPSDISTSAADFQEDGTAAPGSTGRVADAGHVHPAASLGYQIVSQDFSIGTTVNVTINAPAGSVVVGGGFLLSGSTAMDMLANAPLADGSGWNVRGNFQFGSGTSITVYAICVSS